MFNFQLLAKYVLEGLAVALAAYIIPMRKVELKEVVLIALTAAAVFAILDQFTPLIGESARQGAGFGIGLKQVGWGQHNGGIETQSSGSQSDRASCVCEIDVNDMKKKFCPVHTTSEEMSVLSGNQNEVSSTNQSSNSSISTSGVLSGGRDIIEAFDGFQKHF